MPGPASKRTFHDTRNTIIDERQSDAPRTREGFARDDTMNEFIRGIHHPVYRVSYMFVGDGDFIVSCCIFRPYASLAGYHAQSAFH